MVIKNGIISKYRILYHNMLSPKREIYIHKAGTYYYLAKYVPKRDFGKVSEKKQNFIKCLWKYKDGDQKAFEKISELFLRFVEELVRAEEITGNILITCVPRSSDGKKVMAATAAYVASYARADGCTFTEGVEYIKRVEKLLPIHSGACYSVEEIKASLAVRKEYHYDTVIVIDDVIKSGNSFRASEELLYEQGAQKVYCLSLFKV